MTTGRIVALDEAHKVSEKDLGDSIPQITSVYSL